MEGAAWSWGVGQMGVLELRGVTKCFGGFKAVSSVSLNVEEGEYMVLLGPTGAGKTTLMRLISGLLRPDEGDIIIEGQRCNDLPPEDRGVGYFFQFFALFPHMTVWDNVTFGPRVRGWEEGEVERVAREMLEMVHLADRAWAYPRELSGGMQQRVALARALATGVRLLLLDEPLSQLDAKIRFELQFELRKLVKSLRLTAIHVTNDVEEAMAIADSVAVLRRGSIQQVGLPEEIYSKPSNLFVANFVGEANVIEGVVKEARGDLLEVELSGGARAHFSGRGFKPRKPIVAIVKPERVRVEAGEASGLNNFTGRLRDIVSVMGFKRYLVQLDIGLEVASKMPRSLDRGLQVDQRVTASFKPQDCLLYPYPEEGLRRALALD